jgi:hypothetical protein
MRRLRNVSPPHDFFEIGDAFAFVAQSDGQHFLRTDFGHAELRSPSAPILECVAGDFRDRGGNPSLILGIKLQRRGNRSRLLTNEYYVIFVSDLDGEKIERHERQKLKYALLLVPLHHHARV